MSSSTFDAERKKINELNEKQSVPREIYGTDEKQSNLLKLNDWYVGTDEKGGVGKDTKESDVPQWKRLRFDSEEDYLKMISN